MTTIAKLLDERARTAGADPAIVVYDFGEADRTELGHATLANWVHKTANLLELELDVGHDEVVVLAARPSWLTAVLVLGCWRAGATVALSSPDAAAELARDLGARLTVVAEADAAITVDTGLLVLGGGMAGRLTGPLPHPDALGFAEEVLACHDEHLGAVGEPDTAALIVGDIRLTNANLVAAAENVAATGLGRERVGVLDPLRLGHLVWGLFGVVVGGGTAVWLHGGDAQQVAKALADERCPALVGGGDLDRLVTVEKLRHVVAPYGASREAAERVASGTGAELIWGHGIEAACCASSLVPLDSGDELRHWLAATAAPTVGVALPGADVAALGPEGEPVIEGQRGRICVRGPVVSAPSGDWLDTGDDGYIATGPDGREWIFLA